MSFSRILIANRGEIAVRVQQTAQEMGFETVAVYSDADRDTPHVAISDVAVCLGLPPVAESYLNADRVLAAARTTGADAIHPGYGFLSENADFAQRVLDEGIAWIGPSPHAIRSMGDKSAAKAMMIQAGVPCIPGYNGEDQSTPRLLEEGRTLGVPLMVKAAAGGGGRGMRLVTDLEDLEHAITSARSEALGAFGSGTLLLERAVTGARHIEIQVFGDTHGNVVHLGERECSIQRRHQKVIEEAPSPAVDEELRTAMGAAAVAAAQAIDYVGAGTVEFLLDADKNFYFLEMNTRLQVEHRVTEMVTGLDLVRLQLEVASGLPLPLDRAPTLCGHAIEARLYAEAPALGFLPQTGTITRWRPTPATPTLKVDTGVREGGAISFFYDPMVAKFIAQGPTREETRRRLRRALRDVPLLGVQNNASFLREVLNHETYIAGDATTKFLEEVSLETTSPTPAPTEALAIASVLFGAPAQGWSSTGVIAREVLIRSGEEPLRTSLTRTPEGSWEVVIGAQTHHVDIEESHEGAARVRVDGVLRRMQYAHSDTSLWMWWEGQNLHIEDITYAPPKHAEASSGGTVRAPMSGRVQAVYISPGQHVTRGQSLLVLEAMKMEHDIQAPIDGEVTILAVETGMQMSPDAIMVEITPHGDAPES